MAEKKPLLKLVLTDADDVVIAAWALTLNYPDIGMFRAIAEHASPATRKHIHDALDELVP